MDACPTASQPVPLCLWSLRSPAGPLCPPHPPQGYVFALVSALMSAVAAVYTEWVLKKNNDTLYWQNMLLYGFGAAFNFANLAQRWAPPLLRRCCHSQLCSVGTV